MKTASSLPARATAILNNKTAKHIDILDSKAFKLPRLLSQRILYHRRTGRGGEGGCSPPPKFWATQIFWAARENLGKASF